MICANFCWIWPSCSGQKAENVKSLQRDEQTEDGQQAIGSSFELSAQVIWKEELYCKQLWVATGIM